jgi:hypothetical protein
MPRIKCPECYQYNRLEKWNDTTEYYGWKNKIKGQYGGSWDEKAFVVCPFCDKKIDIQDFKREADNADFDEDDDW